MKNTNNGTVLGQVQGPSDAVKSMKQWLSTEGSKHSRIDKAEFRNEKTISKATFEKFVVKH